MADQKNHSFISNSKIRRFTFSSLLFVLPVIIILIFIELALRQINFPEKVKAGYIEKNSDKIEVLFLGSSQVERAINPEYLKPPAINLANSSQRLYEDFELLKNYAPRFQNLKLIVIEVSYDRLHRDKTFTSEIVDHNNLTFYKVNTFGRDLKIQDYFLFHANPEFYSTALTSNMFNNTEVLLNEYGFDVKKYGGSYKYAGYNNSLIKDEDIFIENVKNKDEFKHNTILLNRLIKFADNNHIAIILYSPPTHNRFNNLRNIDLIHKRDSLVKNMLFKNPNLKALIMDEDPNFEIKHFYNANHLNPDGAELATQKVNDFILENYY
jgi:hypothetical protein